jgi:hypothetical protein
MKKISNAFLLLIFCATISDAQVGDSFPELTAETVENKKVTIPDDTKGKFTLVGLAYSKKSEEDLNTWFTPVYNKFVRSAEDAGLFADFTYDINVYFVPMFTGVKAAAQGTAKRQALKELDESLYPHMLFYKGELKIYKEALDFEHKDVPYFFVLDKDGKIIYATSGAFSDKKLGAIEELIDDF